MPESFFDRLKHGWNAFINRDPIVQGTYYIGSGSSQKPDVFTFTGSNSQTIVAAIYNRISIDCSSISIRHVRLNGEENYTEIIHDGIDSCFNLAANKDQTGKDFVRDIVQSMFDEGVVAIVPIDTDVDPLRENSVDIESMRTAQITQWFPDYVQLNVYNDRTGLYQLITMPKSKVAIIENPFYQIMNAPNSVLRRLLRKLAILDAIDEQSGSGKMNLIIQLPYITKTPLRKQQAEERRSEIERQLVDSKYGIAYTDGTEHITQLNRSIDNNLMSQIKYLTDMLYSQLGLTDTILNGTADEKTMSNYYSRVIEPIMSAIVDSMKPKFLTKTARTQRQSFMFFRDPFKLMAATQIAEISDKLTRNEIASSNEIRQKIGLKPIDNPRANELVNKNINQSEDRISVSTEEVADENYSEGGI